MRYSVGMIAMLITHMPRQMRNDFANVLFMGDYCGVTVLTAVFSLPNQAFNSHSFIAARVAMLQSAGVPAFTHNANQQW
jgi:hypothetical protein